MSKPSGRLRTRNGLSAARKKVWPGAQIRWPAKAGPDRWKFARVPGRGVWPRPVRSRRSGTLLASSSAIQRVTFQRSRASECQQERGGHFVSSPVLGPVPVSRVDAPAARRARHREREPADGRHPGARGACGGARHESARHRRERRGQGSRRARDPHAAPRAPRARSSRSTARASPRRFSSPSCSAT